MATRDFTRDTTRGFTNDSEHDSGQSWRSGGRGLDLGDRNPSQGFTGGYGGGVAERGGNGLAGGSYATSGLDFGRPDRDASGYGVGSAAPERGPHSGRGSKNYRRSDQRIEEDVHELLMRHGDLDAGDVDVRVENGEVTLSGEVEDRRAKRLAEDLAERASGVRDVHNQLKARRGLMDKIGDALGMGDDGDRNDRDVSRPAGRETVVASGASPAGRGRPATAGTGAANGKSF